MSGQPGRLQATFNSLELGPRLHERSELKYFQTGLSFAENIEALPQGGFAVAAGTRHVGEVADDASRLIDFRASNGDIYDIVAGAALATCWGVDAQAASFAHPYTAAQIRAADAAQQLDTLLLFHEEVEPRRVLYDATGPAFTLDVAPLENLPTYDYGDAYVNGVAAKWELQFVGFEGTTPAVNKIAFVITLNNVETPAIKAAMDGGGAFDNAGTATAIDAALAQLAILNAGYAVTAVSTDKVRITFTGAGNLGDKWAVSAEVKNKADAAIVAFKTVVGVTPGEPLVSAAKGWPRCGVFYQQRLLMGGFKSLPSAWIASITGDFFNFDDRVDTADGSFLVILDTPGGDAVRRLVNNQFLLVLCKDQNFWVAGSAEGLSKTVPPKHVPASDHGVADGVPVVQNEGAAIYINASGDFMAELRYTDIDGNYKALDISLLGYHLIRDAIDVTVQRKENEQAANVAAIVNGDGSLRRVMMLREQDVTGFVRAESDGATFHAALANGRNELSVVTERSKGAGKSRRLERFEAGQLLHGAISFSFDLPMTRIQGLGVHEGACVWAIADDDVVGPFTVEAGRIDIPKAAKVVTVGRWSPPLATTLPLPRERAQGVVVKRKGRIHTIHLDLEDTTSLAVSANGGKAFEIDLARYGGFAEGVPELQQGFTGTIKLSGFAGWSDLPKLTITQTRPGRLTVRSITTEAKL